MKIDLRGLKSTQDLIDWVRRQLGAPILKVEVTNQHIYDNIVVALSMWLRYATGQSTEEAYYTLMLKGGQSEYELDPGIIDIIEFDSRRLCWWWHKYIIHNPKPNVQCRNARF